MTINLIGMNISYINEITQTWSYISWYIHAQTWMYRYQRSGSSENPPECPRLAEEEEPVVF